MKLSNSRKAFLILLLSFSFAPIIFAQADSGFTNKTEAANRLVNGVKEGKWIQYFKIKEGLEVETNSKHAPIYRLTIYKGGKPLGLVKEYYKTGELWSTTLYTNDWATGVRKEFFAKGILIIKDTILDDKGNGMVQTYYDNGRIEMNFPLTIGTNGGIKIYIKSPQRKSELLVCGTMNGLANLYYKKNSKLELLFQIKSDTAKNQKSSINIHTDKRFYLEMGGVITDTSKYYCENGQLGSESPYVKGELSGIVKDYYENGAIESETSYVNGKLNGVSKGYDKNGKIENETPFVDGKITGVVKHYYPNGKLKSEATFQQNELIGREKKYDENGRPIN